jgi:hypothetical protein
VFLRASKRCEWIQYMSYVPRDWADYFRALIDRQQGDLGDVGIPDNAMGAVAAIPTEGVDQLVQAGNANAGSLLAATTGVSNIGILVNALSTTLGSGIVDASSVAATGIASLIGSGVMSGGPVTPLPSLSPGEDIPAMPSFSSGGNTSAAAHSSLAIMPYMNFPPQNMSSANSSCAFSVASSTMKPLMPPMMLNISNPRPMNLSCPSSTCPAPVTETCTTTETWYSTRYSDTVTLYSFADVLTVTCTVTIRYVGYLFINVS